MDRVLACLYSCKSEGGRRIKWVEQQRSVYVSSLRYIPLYLSIIPLIIFVRCLERIRLELNGKHSRETSFQVKGFGNLRSRRDLSSLQRGFDFSDAPNEIVTTIVRWIRENRFWCTWCRHRACERRSESTTSRFGPRGNKGNDRSKPSSDRFFDRTRGEAKLETPTIAFGLLKVREGYSLYFPDDIDRGRYLDASLGQSIYKKHPRYFHGSVLSDTRCSFIKSTNKRDRTCTPPLSIMFSFSFDRIPLS